MRLDGVERFPYEAQKLRQNPTFCRDCTLSGLTAPAADKTRAKSPMRTFAAPSTTSQVCNENIPTPPVPVVLAQKHLVSARMTFSPDVGNKEIWISRPKIPRRVCSILRVFFGAKRPEGSGVRQNQRKWFVYSWPAEHFSL